MNEVDFSDWLRDELRDRDWSQSELSRRSMLSTGTISSIMVGSRNIGPEAARAIARALSLPEKDVFYRAGLLETPPDGLPMTPLMMQLMHMLADRPEQAQRAALEAVRAMLDAIDRNT